MKGEWQTQGINTRSNRFRSIRLSTSLFSHYLSLFFLRPMKLLVSRFSVRDILLITAIMLVIQAPASEITDSTKTDEVYDRDTQEEFVIGYRTNTPPFSYKNTEEMEEDGEFQLDGYSIEICRHIADEIIRKYPGVQVRWEGVQSYNRFEKLHKGEIDLLCGTTTVTLDRLRNFESSLFIFLTGASFVCTQKSRANSIADMEGKKVGYLQGSTTEAVAKRLLNKAKIRWVVKQTYAEAMESLNENSNRQLDCFFADRDVLYHHINKRISQQPLYLSNQYFSLEPYGIFMRRDKPELEFLVNKVLVDIFSADPNDLKSIHGIFNKYFKNAQMSYHLRMLFDVQRLPYK